MRGLLSTNKDDDTLKWTLAQWLLVALPKNKRKKGYSVVQTFIYHNAMHINMFAPKPPSFNRP